MASDSKQRLVEFLDKRAFRPVVSANPDDYPESKRDKLRRVQRATEDERQRYRQYESAEKVYQMYRDDLSSQPAQEIHRDLRELGLPTLNEVRDDFERLAEEVGVKR